MTDPRWTADTEELMARAIAHDRAVRWGYAITLGEDLAAWWAKEAVDFNLRADISVVLTALADAGLLLPPGGQVREEWRVTGNPGPGYPPYDFTFSHRRGDEDPEASARGFVALVQNHHDSGWVDGPHLARRTVHTGPWREAPDA